MDGYDLNVKKKNSPIPIVVLALLLVLLAVGAAAILIYASAPMRKFSRLLSEGRWYADQRDFESALDNYEEALEMAPANTEAVSGLHHVYHIWANSVKDDEPLLSAEIMDDEVEYLTALNEIVDSRLIDKQIEEAQQAADAYRDSDADPFSKPPEDPDDPDDPDDPSDPTDPWATGTYDPLVFLEYAYGYMSKYDYNGMRNVDGTEAADALVQLMKDRGQDVFIYGDQYNGESDFTGEAMGVYVVPSGYYFYYGDYKDGIREGFGCAFWVNGSDSCEMYQGDWKNDQPNGTGSSIYIDFYYDTTVTVTGNFTNGLQDGLMTYSYDDGWGQVDTQTYTAEDGDAPSVDNSDPDMDSMGYVTYVIRSDGAAVTYSPSVEYLGAMDHRYR
ncbi:MAG: hypothetical protein K6E50_03660 [Lachnospiraceae bacterium]|nr:hypothetical protein [Lachnospiraceae bacterium]